MSQQHDIGIISFMWGQPCAEVVASACDVPARAIAWVDLGVDGVGLREQDGEQVVDMRGEGAEGSLVAHETMNVDAEELSAALILRVVLKVMGSVVVGGRERVGGRCSRVVSSGPLLVRRGGNRIVGGRCIGRDSRGRRHG